ncbi:MAG: hypothetical protein ABSG69_04075 [Candidatus Acidiferrum sp.]
MHNTTVVLLNIFYWLMALAPSLPIPLIYLAYRNILANKRDQLSSLMAQPGVFDSYQKRFGKAGERPDTVVENLFNLYYGPVTYILPIVMNVAVISLGVMVGMMRVGVPFALPPGTPTLVSSAPLTLSLGFAGAYLLSLYDTLRRARSSDLSVYSLHFTWVHMVLASILAPLVCRALVPGVGEVVAFGVGAFPLKDTFDYLKNMTKKKLDLSVAPEDVKQLPMSLVEGLDKLAVERLEEEGISSLVDLAYFDPVKLLLKTNKPWAWVIDVIDQALLINYTGPKIEPLRLIGIRGSIEMSVAGDPISVPAVPADPSRAPTADSHDSLVIKLISIAASRLQCTFDEARSLGLTMYADEQVDLIWQLFKPNEPLEPPPPAPQAH